MRKDTNKKKKIKCWDVYKKGGWKTIMVFFDQEKAIKFCENRPTLEVREILERNNMTLIYNWEDMVVNKEVSSNTISPHTKRFVEDVTYEYEVEPNEKDIRDFLGNYPNSTFQEIDELENDPTFIEFMKDRYEQKALEEWEEGNESY